MLAGLGKSITCQEMTGTDDGAVVTRNSRLLALVSPPTTGSQSVKEVSAGSGVFDHSTNARFVAETAVIGMSMVVLVWLTWPLCTLTPAEYSATYHWMFIVEASVVARTKATVFDDAI